VNEIKSSEKDRKGLREPLIMKVTQGELPVVINTVNNSRAFEPASKRIKTGQRVRVDGTQGVVHILE